MTRRMNGALALAVLALAAVVVSAAFAATSATPGVTKKTITIGGTFPLTGPAALYGVIPKAEAAYFTYVNAHGGVNGRQIVFKYYDDGYNPANTVPLTKKLVQQDHVFAVYGSLGTAPTLATRDYLNQAKVPQVLVATGDSYWGPQYKKYPWTIGFQPDYPGESRVYGQFIENKVPQAKIGVLMQDDAYGQNYYNGLVQGLGSAKSKIVDVEKYDATTTDVSQQIVKLKAAGANVFVLFSLPTQTITALVVVTKIGWQPTTFINNVSSSPLFMGLAQKSGANVHGDISATYVYDVCNNPNTATTKLYKTIIAKYDSGADPLDANILYGVASAWTMVQALKKAGPNPTRSGLMNALTQHEPGQPVPLPGHQDDHDAHGAVPDRPADPRAVQGDRLAAVRALVRQGSLSHLTRGGGATHRRRSYLRSRMVEELETGIRRVTFELPFGIDHVHCYFLRSTTGGLILVDTGLGSRDPEARWRPVLDELDAPVERSSSRTCIRTTSAVRATSPGSPELRCSRGVRIMPSAYVPGENGARSGSRRTGPRTGCPRATSTGSRRNPTGSSPRSTGCRSPSCSTPVTRSTAGASRSCAATPTGTSCSSETAS